MKKEEKADGSGFDDFLTKRQSKKATVGIVETTDKLRQVEYITRFSNMVLDYERKKVARGEGAAIDDQVELYVVDIFNGIQKLHVELDLDKEIAYTTLQPYTGADDDDDDDYGPEATTAITEFGQSLPVIARLLRRDGKGDTPRFRTLVIITGIIDEKANLDVLEMFVSDVAIDTNVFKTQSHVCILTEDASVLPRNVVNSTFLIRPVPSTAKEREGLLDEVIQWRKEVCKKLHNSDSLPPLLNRPKEHYLDVSGGLNMNDFQAAILEAYIRSPAPKIIDFSDLVRLKVEIVNSLRGVCIDNLDNAVGFDAVGGYQPVKNYLTERVVWPYEHYDLAQSLGIKTPRGILFFGPPGTGKTFLTKQLAAALDCVFLEIQFEQLKSKWVGESESNLGDLLSRINSMGKKVLVFIDEVDSLGNRQDGGGGSPVHGALFGMMLKWLSDPCREACVIGATNEPERLDPAFVRDQRFEKQIYMGYPDLDARKKIFDIKFSATRLDIGKGVDTLALAKSTGFYSGANIEGIVEECQNQAFKRLILAGKKNPKPGITAADVAAAMTVKKKNVEGHRAMDKSFMAYANDNCDDKSLIISMEKTTPGRGTASGGSSARLDGGLEVV